MCWIIMLLLPLYVMREGLGHQSRTAMLLASGLGEVGRYLSGR